MKLKSGDVGHFWNVRWDVESLLQLYLNQNCFEITLQFRGERCEYRKIAMDGQTIKIFHDELTIKSFHIGLKDVLMEIEDDSELLFEALDSEVGDEEED